MMETREMALSVMIILNKNEGEHEESEGKWLIKYISFISVEHFFSCSIWSRNKVAEHAQINHSISFLSDHCPRHPRYLSICATRRPSIKQIPNSQRRYTLI